MKIHATGCHKTRAAPKNFDTCLPGLTRTLRNTICLLSVLCLSACSGTQKTRSGLAPDDGPLKLLISSCEAKENQLVTCALAPFKIGLLGYTQTLEDLHTCFQNLDEAVALCAIDKAELQGNINYLQAELEKWYHNPWIMGLIGAAAGAAVATGIILY